MNEHNRGVSESIISLLSCFFLLLTYNLMKSWTKRAPLSLSGVPEVLTCLLSISTPSTLLFNFSMQIHFCCSLLSKAFFSNISNRLPLTSISHFSLWAVDYRLPALPQPPVFRAVTERGSGPHRRWTGGPGCGGPGTCAPDQVTTPYP